MKTLTLLFSISFFVSSYLLSQNGIVSTGGINSGSSGQISYSIGQISYISTTPVVGEAIQPGVQQIYTRRPQSSVDELTLDNSPIVYPNPAHDILNIRWDNMTLPKYDYFIYSLDGKLLLESYGNTTNSTLSIKHIVANQFIIKILNSTNSYTYLIHKKEIDEK